MFVGRTEQLHVVSGVPGTQSLAHVIQHLGAEEAVIRLIPEPATTGVAPATGVTAATGVYCTPTGGVALPGMGRAGTGLAGMGLSGTGGAAGGCV